MGGVQGINLKEAHPKPVQTFVLWQAFLQNVNPVSKVIHAPTVQEYVVEATRDFDKAPRNVVALLFAIYAAATMSMTDEDCQDKLGESRKVLMSRYLNSAQQLFATAGLLRSRSITLIQAFTIWLVSR
jgi:hypothetical protein